MQWRPRNDRAASVLGLRESYFSLTNIQVEKIMTTSIPLGEKE